MGDIFRHFEDEQYASRRSLPDCTLVSTSSAERVTLEPSVVQALKRGQVASLLLASHPGYAIVPKMADPQRIEEWGINYQHLGIGPASNAMQVRIQGDFILSAHPSTRDYVLDVPFGVYEVHCHGEHGPLPIAAICFDDRKANLDRNAPRLFRIVDHSFTISPHAAPHLCFGIRGRLGPTS